MTKRIEKVNSLLGQEIGKIISRDFDFTGAIVTVTRINATPNLIEAKAYISVFPEEKTGNAVELLNHNVRSIQQQINKAVNMRPVPKIFFVRDKTIDEAIRVEKLLKELKKERK